MLETRRLVKRKLGALPSNISTRKDAEIVLDLLAKVEDTLIDQQKPPEAERDSRSVLLQPTSRDLFVKDKCLHFRRTMCKTFIVIPTWMLPFMETISYGEFYNAIFEPPAALYVRQGKRGGKLHVVQGAATLSVNVISLTPAQFNLYKFRSQMHGEPWNEVDSIVSLKRTIHQAVEDDSIYFRGNINLKRGMLRELPRLQQMYDKIYFSSNTSQNQRSTYPHFRKCKEFGGVGELEGKISVWTRFWRRKFSSEQVSNAAIKMVRNWATSKTMLFPDSEENVQSDSETTTLPIFFGAPDGVQLPTFSMPNEDLLYIVRVLEVLIKLPCCCRIETFLRKFGEPAPTNLLRELMRLFARYGNCGILFEFRDRGLYIGTPFRGRFIHFNPAILNPKEICELYQCYLKLDRSVGLAEVILKLPECFPREIPMRSYPTFTNATPAESKMECPDPVKYKHIGDVWKTLLSQYPTQKFRLYWVLKYLWNQSSPHIKPATRRYFFIAMNVFRIRSPVVMEQLAALKANPNPLAHLPWDPPVPKASDLVVRRPRGPPTTATPSHTINKASQTSGDEIPNESIAATFLNKLNAGRQRNPILHVKTSNLCNRPIYRGKPINPHVDELFPSSLPPLHYHPFNTRLIHQVEKAKLPPHTPGTGPFLFASGKRKAVEICPKVSNRRCYVIPPLALKRLRPTAKVRPQIQPKAPPPTRQSMSTRAPVVHRSTSSALLTKQASMQAVLTAIDTIPSVQALDTLLPLYEDLHKQVMNLVEDRRQTLIHAAPDHY